MINVPWSRLISFFRGRSVAVVGGMHSWDQEQAEQADIVVRINSNVDFQGGRCDVLVVQSQVYPPTPSLMKDFADVQLVLYECDGKSATAWEAALSGSRSKLVPYSGACYQFENTLGFDTEWMNTLSHELGSRPLTGIAAIAFVLMFPIRELFITGFDFYYSRFGFIPWEIPGHLLHAQVEWLAKRAKNNSRIIIDSTLREVCFDSEKLEAVQRSESLWFVKPLGLSQKEFYKTQNQEHAV